MSHDGLLDLILRSLAPVVPDGDVVDLWAEHDGADVVVHVVIDVPGGLAHGRVAIPAEVASLAEVQAALRST